MGKANGMKKWAIIYFLLITASAPLRAQICTPDFCEIPIDQSVKEREEVVAISHGYQDAETFVRFLRDVQNLKEGRKTERREKGQEKGGFWVQIVLAFLAGLALNLSPCVLPMIPIQVAVLGMGKRAKSRHAGIMRGVIYGVSIAITYGVLGVVAVRTGGVFGGLQSRAWFQFGVGGIFLILSLALFGAFPIDFSRYSKRVGSSVSLVGLFFMGVTSALLAGACVAPAVMAVILYATELYSAGNGGAFVLPLALGCGMGVPWPLVGGGIGVLPKPGRWMRYVKLAFALIVAVMAVRYFAVGWRLLRPIQMEGERGRGVTDYREFEEAYRMAKSERKPILIDFFASWCGSCETMEKTTFVSAEVQKELERFVFMRVQVEDPLEDEAVRLLTRFGVRGFPAIVVLPEAERE